MSGEEPYSSGLSARVVVLEAEAKRLRTALDVVIWIGAMEVIDAEEKTSAFQALMVAMKRDGLEMDMEAAAKAGAAQGTARRARELLRRAQG